MRLAFLGNHTVGVRTLEAAAERADVALVVAHPADPEDGVRYESVFEFARRKGWEILRSTPSPPLFERIAAAAPDLLWITDYRYLLPPDILALPRLGAVNLHPSLLPKYRGRASINWAILNGEKNLGLTAHFVDGGMDTGDVISQVNYELREDQDVGDALDLLYPLYGEVTRQVLGQFCEGAVSRRPQDHAGATAFPARRPEDGLVDWRRPCRDVLNLVRAVARPYPGAFTYLGSRKVTLWKAAVEAVRGDREPGEIVDISEGSLLVNCADGALRVTEFGLEPYDGAALRPGKRLRPLPGPPAP